MRHLTAFKTAANVLDNALPHEYIWYMIIKHVKLSQVKHLFEEHHPYKGVGAIPTYVFAVFENDLPVAAFTWQPATPGTAKSVCPKAPHCVLALSRMVAVPKTERKLKHVSKPLMIQMKQLIDRTRWPVLVTYSDEGLGHTGYVYKCSGWKPTARTRTSTFEKEGVRVSKYVGGRQTKIKASGTKFLQRWEHWRCAPDEVATWLEKNGWEHVPVNRKWASGRQAFKWIKVEDLTNKVFDRLTVVEPSKRKTNSKNNNTYWICRCSCGKITEARGDSLKAGLKRSCGCLIKEVERAEDLTNQIFGILTVRQRNLTVGKRGTFWDCLCACGNVTTVSANDLKRKHGSVSSCGCLRLTDNPFSSKDLEHSYNVYKKTTPRRGLVFDLSIDEFILLVKQGCHYCGKERKKPNGLDRVDNSMGYVIGNVVPCCWPCNKMKGAWTKKEFLDHVRQIAEFNLALESKVLQ
jgi:hypothetical protein